MFGFLIPFVKEERSHIPSDKSSFKTEKLSISQEYHYRWLKMDFLWQCLVWKAVEWHAIKINLMQHISVAIVNRNNGYTTPLHELRKCQGVKPRILLPTLKSDLEHMSGLCLYYVYWWNCEWMNIARVDAANCQTWSMVIQDINSTYIAGLTHIQQMLSHTHPLSVGQIVTGKWLILINTFEISKNK